MKQRRRTTPTNAAGIHKGERTHNQDQSMHPVSFRTTKMINRIDAVEAEDSFMAFSLNPRTNMIEQVTKCLL